MSLQVLADGARANRADIVCGHCHKPLSFEPPPFDIQYWYAFCSAECMTSWRDRIPGKVLGA